MGPITIAADVDIFGFAHDLIFLDGASSLICDVCPKGFPTNTISYSLYKTAFERMLNFYEEP